MRPGDPTAPPVRFPVRKIASCAAILGSFCFVLNNLAIWSGMLHPPAGYVPRYALGNLDIAIYLTWMELAPTHWLLPNFQAPWASDDALLSPLVLMAGKLSHWFGLSAVTGFQIFQFFFYLVAAFALGTAVWMFCPTRRQRITAAIAIFASIPLPLLALGWVRATGKQFPLLWIGMIQYAYDTSDGLLRGGASNSFTLSFGTAANLFGLCLLTRFVRKRRSLDLALLAVVAFLSAFFHPVEVFVITSASLATFAILAWRERSLAVLLRSGAVVGGAAALGLLPYAIQTSRSEWVRDVSRLYEWQPSSVLWVPLVFGIPTVLVTYFLLMRFRLKTPGDEVLRTWFLVSVALLFAPGIPFKLHVFDGFPYVTAILLVRLLSGHMPIRAFLGMSGTTQDARGQGPEARGRRLVYAVMTAAVVLCAPGYAALYGQIWHDGRAGDPELLLSAVSRVDEPVLIDWLRHHAQRDQVIMGPLEISPWLATVPMPSLASHDLFGMTYEEQSKFVGEFYEGKLSQTDAAESLSKYGVHYVVVARDSPGARFLGDRKVLGDAGSWRIYELPEGRRQPYPGLALLRPDVAGKFNLGGMIVAARKILAR